VTNESNVLLRPCRSYEPGWRTTIEVSDRFPVPQGKRREAPGRSPVALGGSRIQSSAKDVDTYIQQAPEERRSALTRLRDLCRQELKEFDEKMAYGGPSYARRGEIEVGFASQRNYTSLCILRQDALASQRAALAGLSVGRGCIRYTKPEKIDYSVVRKMLVATRRSNGPVC